MSYISFLFFGFICITTLLYYCVPIKQRPYILLIASVTFYLFADWKYSLCLFFIIILTYFSAIFIDKNRKYKKLILVFYLILSAGSLFTIKYANYSISMLSKITDKHFNILNIIVPLGVSFYTLQAIGYVVDIYREKYACEKNFLKFSLFMSYFPIIVQGPISRYNQLSEQLFIGHKFEYKNFKFGLQLALWGLFKKLVIANRASTFADNIFNNYPNYFGLVIVFAILLYTIQIYADFSGCVDICRGVSQLFGIEIINNFDHPYFAVSIKDFWRRWHISLSSWLRDYVYIPLGGNRNGTFKKHLNIILTFFISGLWHGVGIHYIVWGLYHGACQVIGEIIKKPKEKFITFIKIDTSVYSYRLGQQVITFILIAYSWLLFRANGFRAAVLMTKSIFVNFFCIEELETLFFSSKDFRILLLAIVVLFIVSLLQSKFKIREALSKQNLWFRWSIYVFAIFTIIILGVYGSGYNASDFLYMQF